MSTQYKRLHLYISGYVQGVGFRWHAERVARSISGITGFVRNLEDGRVEVVIEGDEALLRRFTEDLKKGALGRNIDRIEIVDEPYTGKFSDFSIAF